MLRLFCCKSAIRLPSVLEFYGAAGRALSKPAADVRKYGLNKNWIYRLCGRGMFHLTDCARVLLCVENRSDPRLRRDEQMNFAKSSFLNAS